MAASPIPECPDIHAVLTTDLAVHLILRVDLDWEAQREEAVAELERKIQAATGFAASPGFKARYGGRIGVLRVQCPNPPPSIVAHLLAEQGIELEHLPAPGAMPASAPVHEAEEAPTCSFCGRDRLAADKALMTDSGWACPACYRAWQLKTEPQLGKKPRRLRLPPRLIIPLLILLAVVFAAFAYYELGLMNGMNQTVRQHLPRE